MLSPCPGPAQQPPSRWACHDPPGCLPPSLHTHHPSVLIHFQTCKLRKKSEIDLALVQFSLSVTLRRRGWRWVCLFLVDQVQVKFWAQETRVGVSLHESIYLPLGLVKTRAGDVLQVVLGVLSCLRIQVNLRERHWVTPGEMETDLYFWRAISIFPFQPWNSKNKPHRSDILRTKIQAPVF